MSDKPKVMAIVDDESSLRMRFRLTLQRVGIVVQNFIDFEDADSFIENCKRARAEGNPFNFAFIDINLKSGTIANGLDLVKRVRDEMNGHMVIAVITTSTRSEEVSRAYENGADCYIVKSGKLNIFSERIKAFKAAYMDTRSDVFRVFGEEELIGHSDLLRAADRGLPKLRHLT